jgi:hypothetical protein
VNRNEARRRVEKASYLHTTEKAILYNLLLRADNGDCAVPHQYTPTEPELAQCVALKVRALQYALKHIDHHGWLDVQPGSGRGNKSTYLLLPRVPDDACHCRKAQRSAPFSAGKGAISDTEKVQSATASSQVNPSSALKAMKGEKVKGAVNDDELSDDGLSDERPAEDPNVVPFTRRIGHRTPKPDWSRWPEDTQGAELRGRRP